MVTLRFFKVHFALNLPMNWSGSQCFDPGLGSGGIVHILFWPIFTIALKVKLDTMTVCEF